MKEKIKNLILLQECDSKIRAVERKRDEMPVKTEIFEKNLNEKILEDNVKFEKLDHLRKERRVLEQTVQDLENKASNSKVKLSNIKSNKEYTALLKEIETLEKSKVHNEDLIIQIMEEIEKLDQECLSIKKEQERDRAQLEHEKSAVEKEIVDLNMEIAELKKQREGYSSSVDRELLGKYNIIKNRKAGVAIGAVIEGICQSCHMNIPPQMFNELRKCNDLMVCPHCNRLVYWGDDEYFSGEISV